MARQQAPPAAVTEDEYRRLCELLYRRTGLSFDLNRRYFVDRRLAERMAALGLTSFPEYFGRLHTDAGELQNLTNAVTVNETYFYREEHQFRSLSAEMLDQIVRRKRPGEAIRIWSIPCATGEEPYSIAMWLLENWPAVDDHEVEIVGSDIDTNVLRRAEQGVYGERALMRLPADLIERYFHRLSDAEWQIDAALRESIRFTKVNLADRGQMAIYRGFDVVFCRNLLIYFDERSRRDAANNLYDAMNPLGFICLGHTESMSRISPLFKVCRFADAIVYQKPESGHA